MQLHKDIPAFPPKRPSQDERERLQQELHKLVQQFLNTMGSLAQHGTMHCTKFRWNDLDIALEKIRDEGDPSIENFRKILQRIQSGQLRDQPIISYRSILLKQCNDIFSSSTAAFLRLEPEASKQVLSQLSIEMRMIAASYLVHKTIDGNQILSLYRRYIWEHRPEDDTVSGNEELPPLFQSVTNKILLLQRLYNQIIQGYTVLSDIPEFYKDDPL